MTNTTFYQSTAWVKLMSRLRVERISDDGLLYCEYCHKPIVAKYDCIGHHVTELTDRNVDDATIALNPDNIMLVHHRCHNRIHNKLDLTGRRNVYLVYGSPFAGKMKYVSENSNVGDLIVEMNLIWKMISGNSNQKPPTLKGDAFAVRDALLDRVQHRAGRWVDSWVVGGYPLTAERQRLLRTLGARPVFVDTPRDQCERNAIEQAQRDGVEPSVYLAYVAEWWSLYTPPVDVI